MPRTTSGSSVCGNTKYPSPRASRLRKKSAHSLVDATAELGDLYGHLRLEAEAVGPQRETLQHVGAERLVADLHVGEVEAGHHVGDERERAVGDVVPEVEHAMRAAVKAVAEDHV